MVDGTYATIYDLLYSVTKASDKEKIQYVIDQLNLFDGLDTDEKKVLDTFNNLCNDVGGIPDSGTLVSRDITFTNANTISENSLEDLTKIFIQNKRKMKFSSDVTNILMDVTKPGDTLESSKEKLLELINNSYIDTDKDKVLSTFSEEKLKEIINKEEPERGVPFGIDFIDEVYPGLTHKSFNIIAGYTGSLKTTLALNQCFIAMQMGYNCLYFSLEVSAEEAIISLMSLYTISCTNEPIKREDMNKLIYKDKEKFSKIYNEVMSLPGKIMIYDESMLGTYGVEKFNEVIRNTEKRFIEETKNGLFAIYLDHAQLLKYDEKSANKDPYQVINTYASYFRQLAARQNYAVTMVSQTSRQGYEYAYKHGGQYLLTGLAESNELERGATCVISVFNSDELRASGQLQVQILKNRYGEVMLEPQAVSVRPEYYLVGNGYQTQAQQVGAVFDNNDSPFNPFENNNSSDEINLDSLLSGM